MAKKISKEKVQTNINRELYDSLEAIEKERGISVDYMITQIQRAIITACKNTYGGNDDATVRMEPDTGIFEVFLNKRVAEEVFDPNREIQIDKAREINPNVTLDDKVGIRLDPKDFGRIVVQTARNIIRQGIRDGEKGQALAEYQSKLKEIVSAHVEQVDPKTGNVTLRLGKSLAILPKAEQVPGEVISEGDDIKVYIVDIKTGGKDPRAIISRTHPDFVKRLFEAEVPEIFDGTVEIKFISREAGSRTKIAVCSRDENVDAIGACIGPKGQRVGTIVEALSGEKIDIVEFSEETEKFITSALSPAEVLKIEIADPDSKTCRATVPDSQLSLAIGNKGQNVRLAAKLTGWKIDIRPESGFYGEDEEESAETAEQSEETAEQTEEIAEQSEETTEQTEETTEQTEETTEQTEETTEQTEKTTEQTEKTTEQ